MQRCPKWSIMIKCPLCPVPRINNWWKQIPNSKLLNKTIYQSKQSMIFFVVTFGLFFSKNLLLMSFTIARSGNYLIWCLCLFVELRRKKKVTLQQISYSEETKNFHFQYISILVLISYILQNVTIWENFSNESPQISCTVDPFCQVYISDGIGALQQLWTPTLKILLWRIFRVVVFLFIIVVLLLLWRSEI